MTTEYQTPPEIAIFGALWRYIWLILSVTLLAAGAGYIVTDRTTPTYEAEASLLFRFDREYSPRNLASDNWHGEPIRVNLDGAIHNDLEILGSRRLLQETLTRLKAVPGLANNLATGENGAQDQLLAQLHSRLSIRRVEGTSVAKLTFRHADPEFAEAFLATLIDTHLSTRSSFLNWSPSESIRDVVDWAEERMIDAQRELAAFRAAGGTFDTETLRGELLERRANLRIDLIQMTPDTSAAMQQEIAEEMSAIEAELAALGDNESRLSALEGELESAVEQFRNARDILSEQELSERLSAAHGPSIIYLDPPVTNPNPVGLSAITTSALSGILGLALASLLGLWLSRNSYRPSTRESETPEQSETKSIVASLEKMRPR